MLAAAPPKREPVPEAFTPMRLLHSTRSPSTATMAWPSCGGLMDSLATSPGLNGAPCSLSFSAASDIRYSNSATAPASFAACTYSPVTTYDPAVRYVCLRPQGSMAGIFVAIDKGYFADAGLAVEPVRGFGGMRTANELDQGMFEFAYIDPLSVALSRAKGGKVRMIGGINMRLPAGACFVKERYKIAEPADLAGLRFGAGQSSMIQALLPAWLKDNGVDPARVEQIQLDPAIVVSSLVEGRIDAAECWLGNSLALFDKAAKAKETPEEVSARVLNWENLMYAAFAKNHACLPARPTSPRDAFGQDAGWKWLAMERVGGGTLAQNVAARGGRVSPRTALGVGARLLDTLRALHAKGVLARDIKPENVLVVPPGETAARLELFLAPERPIGRAVLDHLDHLGRRIVERQQEIARTLRHHHDARSAADEVLHDAALVGRRFAQHRMAGDDQRRCEPVDDVELDDIARLIAVKQRARDLHGARHRIHRLAERHPVMAQPFSDGMKAGHLLGFLRPGLRHVVS